MSTSLRQKPWYVPHTRTSLKLGKQVSCKLVGHHVCLSSRQCTALSACSIRRPIRDHNIWAAKHSKCWTRAGGHTDMFGIIPEPLSWPQIPGGGRTAESLDRRLQRWPERSRRVASDLQVTGGIQCCRSFHVLPSFALAMSTAACDRRLTSAQVSWRKPLPMRTAASFCRYAGVI